MRGRWRRLWPALKVLLTLAILGGVGWQFVRILDNPALRSADPTRTPARILADGFLQARPQWLLLSAGLYVLGLGFFAAFWIRLLRALGQRPAVAAAVRAYYIGHLGKYVPGKAWALVLRTTLVRGPNVRLAVAAQSATYETLTTMATGALLAALLFALHLSDGLAKGWMALGLLVLAGIPILPGVFNRLVRRVAAPFLEPGSAPLPAVRTTTLLRGLAITGGGWLLLGVSLWAMLQAVRPTEVVWAWEDVARCLAFMSLAYVAGFLMLPAPGGLGVREGILQQLLALELRASLDPQEAAAQAVVAVLLLRLLWTVAEVVTAAVVYWLPVGQAFAPDRSGSKA
jgi:hypothetical protein